MRKNISIPNSLNERVERLARLEETTHSSIIVQALERFLSVEERKYNKVINSEKTADDEI